MGRNRALRNLGLMALLALVVVCVQRTGTARTYFGPALSKEQVAVARKAYSESKKVQDALRPYFEESPLVDQHSYEVDVLRQLSRPDDKGKRRVLGQLRHIHYRANGVYVATTSLADLSAKRILSVRAATHAPIPLAPKESKRVKRLVLNAHPRATARFGENRVWSPVIQLPIISSRKDPRSGHRIVDLRLGAWDPKRGPNRARVDLSLDDKNEGIVSLYNSK